MKKETIVYDKAKYHHGTMIENKMRISQSEVHTAFYLGWVIEKNLISDFFKNESANMIGKIEKIHKNAIKIYEWWDCVFLDEMLNDEGNKFTSFYFDFEKGQYIHDYMQIFKVSDGPEFFSVKYNEKNYRLINDKINQRYNEWKNDKK